MAHDDPLDDAERRWLRLAEERPDLGAAVDMQRVLVTRSVELMAEVRLITRETSAAPADLLERLGRQRAPVLDLAVDIDAGRLLPFLLGFCDDFIAGGAGDPARRVRAVIEKGEIEPGSLLRASLARRQEAIRQRANHVGVAPDLVWLVAELAVGPVAHQLQHDALVSSAYAPPEVRNALRAWSRGECPACGSWPLVAGLGRGAAWSAPRAMLVLRGRLEAAVRRVRLLRRIGDRVPHRGGRRRADRKAHRVLPGVRRLPEADRAARGDAVRDSAGARPGDQRPRRAGGRTRIRASLDAAGRRTGCAVPLRALGG